MGGCGRAAGAFRCLLNVELGSACAAVNQIDGGSYKDLEKKNGMGAVPVTLTKTKNSFELEPAALSFTSHFHVPDAWAPAERGAGTPGRVCVCLLRRGQPWSGEGTRREANPRPSRRASAALRSHANQSKKHSFAAMWGHMAGISNLTDWASAADELPCGIMDSLDEMSATPAGALDAPLSTGALSLAMRFPDPTTPGAATTPLGDGFDYLYQMGGLRWGGDWGAEPLSPPASAGPVSPPMARSSHASAAAGVAPASAGTGHASAKTRADSAGKAPPAGPSPPLSSASAPAEADGVKHTESGRPARAKANTSPALALKRKAASPSPPPQRAAKNAASTAAGAEPAGKRSARGARGDEARGAVAARGSGKTSAVVSSAKKAKGQQAVPEGVGEGVGVTKQGAEVGVGLSEAELTSTLLMMSNGSLGGGESIPCLHRIITCMHDHLIYMCARCVHN